MVFSATPIGPCGSKIFIAEPENGTRYNGAAARTFRGHKLTWIEFAADRCCDRAKQAEASSPHLNFGMLGTLMRGCGSGAILDAFPIPLGSTATLFNPPAFAGPRAIPLMGTFPVAAEPGLRANRAKEAAGVASIRSTAKAIFTEVFGMGKLHRDSRERRMREADVGSPPAATIKLKFRKAFRCGRSGGKCLHRSCASAGQEREKFPRRC
jgi:hypothetical protein